MSRDNFSLVLMASGVFLMFYNLGSMARIASLENSQQTVTAEVKEIQQWY